MALVAHLAAIDGSLPVLHFFDGWRTSSEMDTIDVIDYESMRPLVDWNKVWAVRHRGMNPEHPDLRGSAQNDDVYFQNREASNGLYDSFPAVVQGAMDRVASVTGRQYHLVDYTGAPDADRVIVIMASGAEVAADTVRYLNENQGYKVGVLNVRLYRPFPVEAFLKAIPATVKSIAVLDRTKEPGAQHEPLCQDVITALQLSGDAAQRAIKVIGGRYGLSSKHFNPAMVKAVIDELAAPSPHEVFTVGINDDITHLSLTTGHTLLTDVDRDSYQSVFYGIGNDGTVGGTKQVASIFGNDDSLYAQAYFSYSAKKSGGYTISQLRVGPNPITASYEIQEADYVACHKASYVNRFDMLDNIKPGGTFVINCPWRDEKLPSYLPLKMRKAISDGKLRLYTIDADKIAASVGLSPRINMPMETVFLYLCKIMPFDKAVNALKDQIDLTYRHEGGEVVRKNYQAVDMAVDALHEVDYSSIDGWLTAPDEHVRQLPDIADASLGSFMKNVHQPCFHGVGDGIPVSALSPDGKMPMGTSAYEKRRIATRIPVWDASKCVECYACSLVCPHAAIRPFLLDADEMAAKPDSIEVKAAHGAPEVEKLQFRIQVYPEDCLGCSSCSLICSGHALTMTPVAEVMDAEKSALDWLQANVKPKESLLPPATVMGSQLQVPCLEFSGACAGCGETPYVKLLTQLMGDRLLIANATGCSSIWGADYPSNPYCCKPSGKGPAWGNSLFEDNAEYGYGIFLSMRKRRERLAGDVRALVKSPDTLPYLKAPFEAWLSVKDDPQLSQSTGRQLVEMLQPVAATSKAYSNILNQADMLGFKSVWAIGGDGWAYDIGFAGLDHVLAQGDPIKILVLDTECYSNTGGQMSKATPRSAVAKYAPDGKRTCKKDLGRMMMTYGNIYVASIALGANYQQAIDALNEAERYDGPALVIAYCPCLMHGIRPGLGHSIVEERRAVEAGYWPLYRFNPEAYARGEEALTIDSVIPGPDHSGENGSDPLVVSPRFTTAEPLSYVAEYINQEDRYADLKMIDPRQAGILQPALQQDTNQTNNDLKKV